MTTSPKTMYKLPSSLTADIDYTASLIKQYEDGKISGGQLKSNRVPMGIYEQRADGHFMLRIRCTGGLIKPEQLRRVAEVGREVGCSHIHITTRQEVQIHDVSISAAIPSLRKLQEAGLGTQGGGGNTIRNMLVDVRTGVDAAQTFDVTPWAQALTTRLIAEKDSFTMPRKLKIAFDVSEATANFALVNDFGFVAKRRDGVDGFACYLGGSVASDPHLGWKVFDFVPATEIFRAVKAAKNFFNENGNRKNRHKARIRYIFYKLGEEEAIALYHKYYDALKDDASLALEPDTEALEVKAPAVPEAEGVDLFAYGLWKLRYANVQPDGLWNFVVPVLHGNASAETFTSIADIATQYGEDVIRFTPRQSIQIRNVPESHLPGLYKQFKALGFDMDEPVIISNIASCTGADTCRLGICLPKGAVEAIKEELTSRRLDLDKAGDVSINLNGCTNMCAQSIWSGLGFSGRIGREGDHAYPAYTVWAQVNGKHALGVNLGWLSAREVPQFIADYVAAYIDRKESYGSHDAFLKAEGADTIKALIAKHKAVPSFSKDKNYYFDWGANEIFSLSSHGKAECSAGLFDIIELDEQIINNQFKKLATPGIDVKEALREMAFSACRMLLVTRGVEPRDERDVYDQFNELFIKAGIVPTAYTATVTAAKGGEDLTPRRDDVEALAKLMIDLYKGMDDSLQFKQPQPAQATPAPAAAEPSHGDAKEAAQTPEGDVGRADVKKDFRGVACPMNFVKTKIALSPMRSGQTLEILLDDGAPIQNVPGSVRNEGHEVISTTMVDGYWKVLIRKK